jgi:hypothetical protein
MSPLVSAMLVARDGAEGAFGARPPACILNNYQEQFLKLLACCDDVIERQQIDIFTADLQNPMKIDFEMQRVESFEDAMALARAFECRL